MWIFSNVVTGVANRANRLAGFRFAASFRPEHDSLLVYIYIKGAMQRDFDDLILAKNFRILHKNVCERRLFLMVNEKETQL